jgi:hypothetical protein
LTPWRELFTDLFYGNLAARSSKQGHEIERMPWNFHLVGPNRPVACIDHKSHSILGTVDGWQAIKIPFDEVRGTERTRRHLSRLAHSVKSVANLPVRATKRVSLPKGALRVVQ